MIDVVVRARWHSATPPAEISIDYGTLSVWAPIVRNWGLPLEERRE